MGCKLRTSCTLWKRCWVVILPFYCLKIIFCLIFGVNIKCLYKKEIGVFLIFVCEGCNVWCACLFCVLFVVSLFPSYLAFLLLFVVVLCFVCIFFTV